MSKLFRLKKWLTLDEAADYLSGALQEPVSVPDLLRLAVDGHLVLSVNFVNGSTGNIGKKVDWKDARLMPFPRSMPSMPTAQVAELLGTFPKTASRQEQHEWVMENRAACDSAEVILLFQGDTVADGILEWDRENLTSIMGLWDLPSEGGSALDVEHLLQSYVDGPEVSKTCLNGTYVVSPDGESYARLLEHFKENPYVKDGKDRAKYPHDDPRSYYPRGGLPADAPIVVRPAALTAFLASIADEGGNTSNAEKPLGERERGTLLCIIGALAKHAGLDLSQPMKAGDTVATMAPELSLSGRTIGEHLKKVGPAMESRTK